MEKKSPKEDSFEKNLENIDIIIEKLESGDLGLDESIKEYEKAMKLLKKSSEMLNKAQGKVLKVTESLDSNEVEFEEV
ncbi:MAG: exodeoxyribonuclease VII small subunit [Fusobacteriaceae bacterium]|nr:exodeoxyribonuclease VII small subunit [Fusobacteriaceae bacterium]MBP6322754.1 exodeoxyribonuclease VII small subunit [Fusobacteriaceae bacterium]MBP9510631.1 exodeoxyribonuclease VII small subunit [Fusobacteriaceae bacterium]